MSTLRLRRLVLFSRINKSAKEVRFDPNVTILTGRNQVGKSRIIKSIFHTLGAECDFDTSWKQADPKSIIEAEINSCLYTFYRDGKRMAAFDSSGRRIAKANSMKEWAPFFTQLFGFKLTLQTQQGTRAVPPPSFMFLPFYIDQDKGWKGLWCSFTNLTQFKSWQPDLIDHLVGIRGSQYYQEKGNLELAKVNLQKSEAELSMANEIFRRSVSEMKSLPAPIDLEFYQQQIAEFLHAINAIGRKSSELKDRLVVVNSMRFDVEHQQAIVNASLKELTGDFETASELPDHIKCPTCGQEHDNDFLGRFEVARDREGCIDLLAELDAQQSSLIEKANGYESERSQLLIESERLNLAMEEKRGEISFSDLVENQGERRMRELVQEQVRVAEQLVASCQMVRDEAQGRIDALGDKGLTKTVVEFLRDRMKHNTIEMGVRSIPEDAQLRTGVNIAADGSERPRTILACFISYLETAMRFGESFLAPVIIDSPLQQDQDPENTNAILKFLSARRLDGCQMILATVSTYGVPFPGTHIDLKNEPYSLLTATDYQNNIEFIDRISLLSLES